MLRLDLGKRRIIRASSPEVPTKDTESTKFAGDEIEYSGIDLIRTGSSYIDGAPRRNRKVFAQAGCLRWSRAFLRPQNNCPL